MANFTPGPWVIRKEDWDYRVPFFTILSGGDAVCGLWYVRGGEIEADANLIAAAPDLYAACKEMATWYLSLEPMGIEFDRAITQLHAAIAKAEGRDPSFLDEEE